MQVRAILLAAVLVVMPLAARAADLIVWWEESFLPEEDQVVRELIDAFEHKTGKRVELVQHSQEEMPTRAFAAIEAGYPPDFLFATTAGIYYSRWTYEGRLADLAEALAPFAAQFDQDALDRVTMLDATTGRRGLHVLPMGRLSNHVHVWRSLLEQAGFQLEDIPKEWEAFWAFWCDKVQPAVRKATGRNNIYGIGLPMSAQAFDTLFEFHQFMNAYEADYVTRDGKLVLNDPEVRRRLIGALDSYVTVHRKGCTPPASVDWDIAANNKAFLAQTVVMTPGLTHEGLWSYTQVSAGEPNVCSTSVLPADARAGRANFRPGLGANGSHA